MSYNEAVANNKTTRLMVMFAFLMVIVAITGAGCPSAPAAQPENKNTQATSPEASNNETVQLPPQASPTATEAVAKDPSANKPTNTKPAAASKYKDGVYMATGDYNSPAGKEEIPVSLTLKGDVIVDASAQVVATNPKSKYMQSEFVGGFKAQVVGKKIDDVKLDKVSGSSLTPKGFNEAVEEIKLQAKA